jgi:hypothetical protein
MRRHAADKPMRGLYTVSEGLDTGLLNRFVEDSRCQSGHL